MLIGALVVASAQGKAPLDPESLREKAAELYGIELAIFLKPSQLLREAVRWARHEVPVALDALPKGGLSRLGEIEASQGRREARAEMFAAQR